MKPGSLLFVILVFVANGCSERMEVPESPDGSIAVALGVDGNSPFSYSIYKDGRVLIHPSAVELEFLNQPDFGGNLHMELVDTGTRDETWEPLWGKTDKVRDHYNEYTYRLTERRGNARYLDWIVRVYNDGVAFRYRFNEGSGFGEFSLTDERSSFSFDPSWTVWAANHETYYSSQEHPFTKRAVGGIGPGELIGCPLLLEAGGAGWILVTEADLTDWAGLYFISDPAVPGRMVSSLASLKRNPGTKVEGSAPVSSPWRVIMIGNDPGDLIESNLVANLNDPVEYDDVDWIRPGISAWDRWWCGDYGPDAGFKLGMNTATMEYFVDLADRMDWEYMIVDWTWYGKVFAGGAGNIPNPDVDITRPIDEVDMEGIIRYAGERGVKIFLWVHSWHLDRQMDDALDTYERWGAAGIKVDFMDNDDQDMVHWYHKVARKAAEHHLLVDFHGAYKPTGVSRTLPNMITREGVLGNEYTKWSDLVTPGHTVVLPYTRGILGEMDFTPGGFHHIHKENFVIVGGDAPNPYVMGTRCHQLAMLVVYESAFMVVCDSPYNYRDQPGSEFLKLVPSTWNETRYLGGYPGEDIIMARRSGKNWFIGGMSNEEPKDKEVPLNFLERGTYQMTLWKDAEDADQFPEKLNRETLEVTNQDVLRIRMEQGGGFVLMVEPSDPGTV